MILFLAVLGTVVMFVMFGLIFEVTAYMVIGGWVDEESLDTYFSKNWEHYEELNPYNRAIISGSYPTNVPFISTCPFTLSSKWYIQDRGLIPRWSKWHERVNKLHDELFIKQI